MFWRTLGRLILIAVAVVLAAGVSIAVLVTLGLEHLTHALHGRGDDGVEVAQSVMEFVRRGFVLASGVTIIPALLVVIAGEVARIRSWLYYMLGGGAALAVIPLLSRMDRLDAAADLPTLVWQVFATAGFAGGLVYWVLAGRRA